ncbi:hypothetical protein [Neobacillus massiliamazoniensis]|nr:hypothetical protein [Neobacillus massiliamazoniensis]
MPVEKIVKAKDYLKLERKLVKVEKITHPATPFLFGKAVFTKIVSL